MIKITRSEDCGNSPKNIFVQELTIAFAKGYVKLIRNRITENIQWDIVGDRQIRGTENVVEALQRATKVTELAVQHVATHGRAGAVNGTLELTNGTTLAFCDVFEFGNTKGTIVQKITSYRIETK